MITWRTPQPANAETGNDHELCRRKGSWFTEKLLEPNTEYLTSC
jgi:hypothetical protein